MKKDNLPKESAKPLSPTVLSVGSKIYLVQYSRITAVIVIERTTKTQAIAKNGTYKFNIDVSTNNYVKTIGQRNVWSNERFYLETEELKQQLHRQKAIDKLEETNFSKLSIETLEALLSILNNT